MTWGGIVLCGGRSSRMGQDKAWLPFGPESMLQRVVRIIQEVVDIVIVSGASDQNLPPLPEQVRIVRDPITFAGPLCGLATAMSAIPESIDAVYVSSCDVPLLQAGFMREMLLQLRDHPIAIPLILGSRQPLSGVYRCAVRQKIEELLSRGSRSMNSLIDAVETHFVGEAELMRVDPQLYSIRNVNTIEAYREALETAGFLVT